MKQIVATEMVDFFKVGVNCMFFNAVSNDVSRFTCPMSDFDFR